MVKTDRNSAEDFLLKQCAVRCPLWSKTQLKMFLMFEKKYITYFYNTSKCAVKFFISYEVYDGFMG